MSVSRVEKQSTGVMDSPSVGDPTNMNKPAAPKNLNLPEYITEIPPGYNCSLCNCRLTLNDITPHIYSLQHENKLRSRSPGSPITDTLRLEFVQVLHSKEYKCSACDITNVRMGDITHHVNGRRHRRTVLQCKKDDSDSTKTVSNDVSQVEGQSGSSTSGETPQLAKAKRRRRPKPQVDMSSPRPPTLPSPNQTVPQTQATIPNENSHTEESPPPAEPPLLGIENFFTKCSLCPQRIFGGTEAISNHISSQGHKDRARTWANFSKHSRDPQTLQKPQLDTNSDTKYFIIESPPEAPEDLIHLVEISKGTARSDWVFFYWCKSCSFRSHLRGIPQAHLDSPFHRENSKNRASQAGGTLDEPWHSNPKLVNILDVLPRGFQEAEAEVSSSNSSDSNSPGPSSLPDESPTRTPKPKGVNKNHVIQPSPTVLRRAPSSATRRANPKVPTARPKKPSSKCRRLDTAHEGDYNIYQMDQHKMREIELGVLLSIACSPHTLGCFVCKEPVPLDNFYDHLCTGKHLNQLQRMTNDHERQRDYHHQFSDFALAQEYITRLKDLWCHACATTVGNDSLLNHHVHNPYHIKCKLTLRARSRDVLFTFAERMNPDYYSTRNYWCVLCQKEWPTEFGFREHLRAKKHLLKEALFGGKSRLVFDFCAPCATLMYGLPKAYTYHLTDKSHRQQNDVHLIPELPQFVRTLLLDPESIVRTLAEAPEDVRNEAQLIRDLERLSRKVYPMGKAYAFGSRITGLAGRNSDLDIFLDCSTKNCPVYSGQNSSEPEVLRRLRRIGDLLKREQATWLVDRAIEGCRAPIIKVTHKPTKIECDISFTSGLSVENSKVIKAYCDNYPRCRELIFFAKHWMEHCELTMKLGDVGISRRGINSYGTSWLVIFYLQARGIIPSIAGLIEKRGESRKIGGWEIGVAMDFRPGDDNGGFRKLLAQFFEFYAAFDYRNYVICPLVGRPVEKELFQEAQLHLLPSSMQPYLEYLNAGGELGVLRADCVMCLQDPFDLSHNVCKAVSKDMVHRLRSLCSLTAGILRRNETCFNGRG